jgi:hypothetical protein
LSKNNMAKNAGFRTLTAMVALPMDRGFGMTAKNCKIRLCAKERNVRIVPIAQNILAKRLLASLLKNLKRKRRWIKYELN